MQLTFGQNSALAGSLSWASTLKIPDFRAAKANLVYPLRSQALTALVYHPT